MPLLVLSICLICRFRVTVSALLSFVGPAHQLLLPLAALKCVTPFNGTEMAFYVLMCREETAQSH